MRPAALALLLAGCATDGPYAGAPPVPPPPADLPEAVHLESPTEDLTHEWFVALRDGRVWLKPNHEAGAAPGPWRPLPPDGLARHRLHDRAGPPPRLASIGADGDNLVALGEDGLVHYLKLHDFGWIDLWGLPPFGEPLHAKGPHRALAMSHRGPLVGRYEDVDGNTHPQSHGVTTLYRLSADGRRIEYADPWLPAHWNRRVCLPREGRLVAAAMSASASTLFVMDRHGHAFTRLADFDTVGDDPLLSYSWRREVRGDDEARTLPGEPWAAQPPVPGPHTDRITIVQTGPGNAGRELRVEGDGGYFHKPLRGAAWSFRATGAKATRPFVEPGPEDLAPSTARDLAGIARGPAPLGGLPVSLPGFDPDCTPATLTIGALAVPLHLIRPDRRDDGSVEAAQGAILLDRTPATPLERALFGDERFAELEAELDAGGAIELSIDLPGLSSLAVTLR